MTVLPRDVPDTIDAKVLADRVIAKKVAALLVSGASKAGIGKELGLKPWQVKGIVESYACKHAVLELSEHAVSTAKNSIKSEVSKMVKGIVATLQHHLDNKNLNAIPHALKILGFSEEEKTEKSQNLTIIMPSAEAPKTVNAEYEEVKE